MRLLFRAFVLLIVALPLLVIAAIAACLQDRPLVTGTAPLTPQDIERAKRIVNAQVPRRAGPDGLHTVAIDERDLGLALNYLAHRLGQGAARVVLRPRAAALQVSLEAPQNPIGRYLNIEAALREAGTVPQFDHLKIGRLPVPGIVADFALREALRRLTGTDRGQIAASVVKSVRLSEGGLVLTYRWSDEVATLARAALVAPDDQARLRAYQERLADALEKAPRTISLATLMPPLFQLVLERGADGGWVRENRAAIVVLALYTIGTPLDRIVPTATQWRQPARRAVRLAGRDDFPKHFLVSAAIAAEAGSPLADAIGVYKEIEDSRGGSGFSFNDIGADRAGTRFGELASQSPGRARELARAVAAGVREADFMPDVSDLPEYLPEAEFRRRYGGVGGPGYQKMMATIEERVAARPLLRR
jgi:hypothetical protein